MSPHHLVVWNIVLGSLAALLAVVLIVRLRRYWPSRRLLFVFPLLVAFAAMPFGQWLCLQSIGEFDRSVTLVIAVVLSIPMANCVFCLIQVLLTPRSKAATTLFCAFGLAPLVWIAADGWQYPYAIAVGIAGFVVLMALSSWLNRRVQSKGWDPRGFLRAALVVLVAIGLYVYLAWDPVRKYPYSWNDVPVPSYGSNEVEACRQVLLKLRKQIDGTGGLVVNMPAELQNMISTPNGITRSSVYANAEVINKTWDDSADYRAVIAELDTYPAIPDTGRGFTAPLIDFLAYRSAAQLYTLHARLKTYQGDSLCAASNIVQLYSVARKRMPYSWSLVDKMILIAVVGLSHYAAYEIASAPEATPETWRLLQHGFAPLTQREITMRVTLIGEFCGASDIMFSFTTNSAPLSLQVTSNRIENALHRLVAPFIINPYATARDYLAVMGPAIERASQWPMTAGPQDLWRDLEYVDSQYRLKNAAGQQMLRIAMPNCIEATRRAAKAKVRSDLFALYLAKRLGEPCDVKDYFTGGQYSIDEKTGLPFSPGPDGAANTDDDIRLKN